MNDRLYIYDLETYLHVFTAAIRHHATGQEWVYEISRRRNDGRQLIAALHSLAASGARMVGFNNEGFDYPILHTLWQWSVANEGDIPARLGYDKAQAIIEGDRFAHTIWPSDRLVEQIDLFKIMHFDNPARSTSLKRLELNMRSSEVIDLPYPIDRDLTGTEIDELIRYNIHDVRETERFMVEIMDRIEFRDALGPDWINHNDTRIGKQTFINEMERAGVACFDRSSGRKQPIQTPRREGVRVGDKLVPIPFTTPDLQRVWRTFKALHVMPEKTKGALEATADLGSFRLHFGVGGIHGSVSGRTVRADDDHDIIDLDVTSYYPSLAIVWGFYPQHLGPTFVDVYRTLKTRRIQYPKGSTENAMLKLALNGVYGDSNNRYGPFYDPAYMLAITTNGQMFLAWLAEMVHDVAELIQINTDGLTVRVAKADRSRLDDLCRQWQTATGMDLESVDYRWMAIRDVNNYVAETIDGKRKRKGAYEIDRDWHKDQSSLVVQKAVDAVMSGADLAEFIWAHDDPFDFMRHVRVSRGSSLELDGVPVQSTSRYFVATDGGGLVKIMPPLAKAPDHERRIGIDAGWAVDLCNRAKDFDWARLNRWWYYQEAKRLLAGCGWSE